MLTIYTVHLACAAAAHTTQHKNTRRRLYLPDGHTYYWKNFTLGPKSFQCPCSTCSPQCTPTSITLTFKAFKSISSREQEGAGPAILSNQFPSSSSGDFLNTQKILFSLRSPRPCSWATQLIIFTQPTAGIQLLCTCVVYVRGRPNLRILSSGFRPVEFRFSSQAIDQPTTLSRSQSPSARSRPQFYNMGAAPHVKNNKEVIGLG